MLQSISPTSVPTSSLISNSSSFAKSSRFSISDESIKTTPRRRRKLSIATISPYSRQASSGGSRNTNFESPTRQQFALPMHSARNNPRLDESSEISIDDDDVEWFKSELELIKDPHMPSTCENLLACISPCYEPNQNSSKVLLSILLPYAWSKL